MTELVLKSRKSSPRALAMLPFVYNEHKEGSSKQDPVGENCQKKSQSMGHWATFLWTWDPPSRTEESQGESPLTKLGRNCHQNQGAFRFPAPHQSPVIYSELGGTQLGKWRLAKDNGQQNSLCFVLHQLRALTKDPHKTSHHLIHYNQPFLLRLDS